MLELIAYGAYTCTNLNMLTTASLTKYFLENSHIQTFVRFGHELIGPFRPVNINCMHC